jgi:signal transduction histidine kinase
MVLGGIVLILFALGITALLERLVISRFVRLSQDVEKINTQKDISIRVQTGVQDDMGRLGAKINQMLTWLSAAQKAEEKAKKEIVGLLDTISHAKEEAEHMVIQRTHELSDEKARLLASINSLSFGFVIADVDNTIIVRNPSLTAILEMEAVPTSITDIAGALKNAQTTFDPVAFAREVVHTKKTMEKAGVSFGKKFLRFLCAPIFADEASATAASTEVIGYVFIVEDITDSKNMERSREEFFSIASHELRTPLTAIRWNTDMLLTMKDKINKKDEEEMLRDVHNSSIRLIEIVGDFLEVSRLEQGKVHVESSLFAMSDLVQKVVHRMQEMADKRGLTLTYEAPNEGESTDVYADPSNTEQVLENLIGNAIKFTQKGTITIHMEHNGPFLKVSVTDTGSGISEHNQTRLFKKFQQAGEDMLARDVNQSTGLGLYISKLLVTAMGGTIALEKSELGKGSTFVFMLPTKAPKA